MQRTFAIQSLDALETAVNEVYELLKTTAYKNAAVLELTGELGTGKTAFVQILARHLGVQEVVTSPTFIIMQSFRTCDAIFKTLVHIDAYRLESAEEMRVLGFESLLKEQSILICIEWPERIHTILPQDTIQLRFSLTGNARMLTVSSREEIT